MKSVKKKQLFLDVPIVFFLLISTTAFFKPKPADAIPTESLDYILYFLRSRGNSLFANAISTSDLLFDVLSLPSLTLLPPSDSSLFSLDMTESPAFYLAALRLHVIPFRIDFRFLQNNSSVHTLLNSRRLHATRDTNNLSVLLLDGVQVLFPPLYYQSNVAVYALRGMLPPRPASPPPFQWFRPPRAGPRNRSQTVVPSRRPVPFNRPIFSRVPSSGGMNFQSTPSPFNHKFVVSPAANPMVSPVPAGYPVLDFPHNRTDYHPPIPTILPPVNQEAPAFPPINRNLGIPTAWAPVNSDVSEISDSQRGPAFPHTDQMSSATVPPELGENNRAVVTSFPPIPPPAPSSPKNISIGLAPSVAPTSTDCPPADISAVAAPASVPAEIGDEDYPELKRDGEWEASEDVNSREDYAMQNTPWD
ncbi:Fasciclin-like arabinogalactan protein 19 [Linum perenne]